MVQSSGQEREVILRRVLFSLQIIARSKNGITIRDLKKKLRTIGPDLKFSEQTIRRDCSAYEYLGLLEPRGSISPWVLRPSQLFFGWFKIQN